MKKCIATVAGLLMAVAGEAAAHGRPVDLSVYDRTEAKRLPMQWHEGRAYVVGKPGNEYQVTVRNRLREPVLALVSVDGVNVISGETADPGQTGYVLSPHRAYDIQGWRKSLSETPAFYFTALPDSYAARTGRPDNVGVIGVALFRRKAEPPAQPIAPAVKAEAARAEQDGRLATGHGRRETSHAQYVNFERATTAPSETITVYYDSYRNLVARGVIHEPVPLAPLPRPFPAHVPNFVPDPRG